MTYQEKKIHLDGEGRCCGDELYLNVEVEPNTSSRRGEGRCCGCLLVAGGRAPPLGWLQRLRARWQCRRGVAWVEELVGWVPAPGAAACRGIQPGDRESWLYYYLGPIKATTSMTVSLLFGLGPIFLFIH